MSTPDQTRSPGTAPVRVVVIEDELTITRAIADRLTAEGWEVTTAPDGPSGVRTVTEVRPDVVVLDVMLPGFDGLEVCRRIQADEPVPVLMLTARDDETDMLVGLGVGADDYMTKPFSMRELVARLKALLRRVRRVGTPAPERGREAGRPGVRRSGDRPGRAPGDARRRSRAPHSHRVRPAAVPRERPRHRAHPRAAPGRRVGLGRTPTGTRTVDSHVKALRRKLGRRSGAHRPRRGIRPGDPRRTRRRAAAAGGTGPSTAGRTVGPSPRMPTPNLPDDDS